MKLCRFRVGQGNPRIGLVVDDLSVVDLSPLGVQRLDALLEDRDRLLTLSTAATQNLPRRSLAELQLLPPVEQQEVWAVGVTYIRSKTARMEESEFSATAYDRVYVAERPELFFKGLPEKVVGPRDKVGIRKDAKWNVPEPELTFVIDSKARLVGFTIGNDMSSRDIEGENLLYLPQAKIYDRSCAVGPWIVVGASEEEARQWSIQLQIQRAGTTVFSGQTSVGQIKRSFQELIDYLFRSQTFPHGVVLLTGTGIVPPDTFTLSPGDKVSIRISGIGLLENEVVVV